MTKRIYTRKYELIIYMLLLVFMSEVKSYAKGILAEGEPFKIKTELELRMVSVPSERYILPRDDFYQKNNEIPIETYSENKKSSGIGEILKFQNISISFSRMIIKQTQIDAKKPAGEGSDKLNELKSLPSTFLTSTYKDTFESIGRIFEPQVNLNIEF